jgi:hypothetical protein
MGREILAQTKSKCRLNEVDMQYRNGVDEMAQVHGRGSVEMGGVLSFFV